MEFIRIDQAACSAFHELLNDYYREGEDENTPQEEVDAFIRLLFDQVITNAIDGCIVREGSRNIGFALWAVDTEDFAFSELPGLGTVLEIGIIQPYRASGRGRELLSYIEKQLIEKGVAQCYVSAYGPAQAFWAGCGFADSGRVAENGLPIMIKSIL